MRVLVRQELRSQIRNEHDEKLEKVIEKKQQNNGKYKGT